MHVARPREESQPNHKALWLGLGIALGGAATGLMIYLILRDRRQPMTLQGGPYPYGFPQQPINIWNVVGNPPPAALAAATAPAAPTLLGSPLTVQGTPIRTLPAAQASDFRTKSLSSDEPRRLFTATKDRTWQVEARVVGPAGAVAYFAMDSGPLAQANPSMDVSIVPAGEATMIFLSPGSTLYGRSSMDDVSVSLNLTSQIPGHVP